MPHVEAFDSVAVRHRCKRLRPSARPPAFMLMWKDAVESIGWNALVTTEVRPPTEGAMEQLVRAAPRTEDGVPLLDETLHQQVVADRQRNRDLGKYRVSVKSPRAAFRPLDEDVVPHEPADDGDPWALYRPDVSHRLDVVCPGCGRQLPVTLRQVVRLVEEAVLLGHREVMI